MPTLEDALCLLVIFLVYGIAGHMDYEDAVLLDETQQNLRYSASTDCRLGTEPQHDELDEPASGPVPEAIALCPPVIY